MEKLFAWARLRQASLGGAIKVILFFEKQRKSNFKTLGDFWLEYLPLCLMSALYC
jgi:hypothetical protein